MPDRKITRIALSVTAAFCVLFLFYSRSSPIPGIARTALDRDDYSDVLPGPDGSGTRITPELPNQRPVIDLVDHMSTHVPGDHYRIVYSQSTKDRRYFHIDLAGVDNFNPNIIPHPTQKDKYIIVAQALEYRDDTGSSAEISCIAEFKDGVLHCPKAPTELPVALSILGDCTEQWSYANMRRGPRDARVFYGLEQPYIMYGSQSHWPNMCLGLWVQNLWTLLDGAKHPEEGFARSLTEIGRPEPYYQIQKNFFLFWDNSSRILAHYDLFPERVFSILKHDGSAAAALLKTNGLNLAQFSYEQDQACMAKYFPKIDNKDLQGLHQGTNTLSITMCKRSDPSCVISNENTFILHIMQHKNFYEAQATYDPYPILFRRHEPYNYYAVATKPLFYHGKEILSDKTGSVIYKDHPDWPMPTGHAVMTYTTSISWKDQKQRYHGYLDDVLFISFGVEDTRSGAIDVLASDLLQDLAYC